MTQSSSLSARVTDIALYPGEYEDKMVVGAALVVVVVVGDFADNGGTVVGEPGGLFSRDIAFSFAASTLFLISFSL